MQLLQKLTVRIFTICWLSFSIITGLFSQDTPDSEGVGLIATSAANAGLEFLNTETGPTSTEHLRAMEAIFSQLADRVKLAAVNVAVQEAQGSGVVVSRDGHVLTAAHVISRPNLPATITFADGSKANAITMGVNRVFDSGMLKITDPGKWPFLELGESAPLERGQWVMAIGHPGGLTEGRSLVFRAGRILWLMENAIMTDCTLVGGDSGGPLVDLNGNVIGIHSRIGGRLWENYHVPIDAFSNDWDELATSSIVGSSSAYIGIELDTAADASNTVKKVVPGEGAAAAGLQEGDVIIKINDDPISSRLDISRVMRNFKPRDQITIQVKRGDQEIQLEVTLGYQ